jgi:hypothetical protein
MKLIITAYANGLSIYLAVIWGNPFNYCVLDETNCDLSLGMALFLESGSELLCHHRSAFGFAVIQVRVHVRVLMARLQHPAVGGISTIREPSVLFILGTQSPENCTWRDLDGTVFWGVTSCNLVDTYQRFGGICRLYLLATLDVPCTWRRKVPPKRLYLFNSVVLKMEIIGSSETSIPTSLFLRFHCKDQSADGCCWGGNMDDYS